MALAVTLVAQYCVRNSIQVCFESLGTESLDS